MSSSTGSHTTIAALSAARWRIALVLTAAMMVLYFGFILLVAFKPLLGRQITDGLSVGILLGALVIIACWLLIWIDTRWANTHYDRAVKALRGEVRQVNSGAQASALGAPNPTAILGIAADLPVADYSGCDFSALRPRRFRCPIPDS